MDIHEAIVVLLEVQDTITSVLATKLHADNANKAFIMQASENPDACIETIRDASNNQIIEYAGILISTRVSVH